MASSEIKSLASAILHGITTEGVVPRLVLDPDTFTTGLVKVITSDYDIARSVQPEQNIGTGEFEVPNDVPTIVDLQSMLGGRSANDCRAARCGLNGDWPRDDVHR